MTVSVSEAVLDGSVVDVAIIVTELPVGTDVGAVKVVVAPLAVCVGENEPQAPELPQVTVQSTPPLAASLLTVATKAALAFATIVLFRSPCVMAMEIGATTSSWKFVTTVVGLAVAAA